MPPPFCAIADTAFKILGSPELGIERQKLREQCCSNSAICVTPTPKLILATIAWPEWGAVRIEPNVTAWDRVSAVKSAQDLSKQIAKLFCLNLSQALVPGCDDASNPPATLPVDQDADEVDPLTAGEATKKSSWLIGALRYIKECSGALLKEPISIHQFPGKRQH